MVQRIQGRNELVILTTRNKYTNQCSDGIPFLLSARIHRFDYWKNSRGCDKLGFPLTCRSWYVLVLVLPVVPLCMRRLVYWSIRSTATFVICFHWSLLLAFSRHFSFVFIVFRNLLASLSRIFSVIYRLSF